MSKKRELQKLVTLYRELKGVFRSILDVNGVSVAGADLMCNTIQTYACNIVKEVVKRMPENLVNYLNNADPDDVFCFVEAVLENIDKYSVEEAVTALSKKIKWCDDEDKVVVKNFSGRLLKGDILFSDLAGSIECMDSLTSVASSVSTISDSINNACLEESDKYLNDLLDIGESTKFRASVTKYVDKQYNLYKDMLKITPDSVCQTFVDGYESNRDNIIMDTMTGIIECTSYSSEFRANVILYGLQV